MARLSVVLSSNTRSDETLSQARSWLERCVASHHSCSNSTDPENWYPSRLLDCGPKGNSVLYCRLIATDGANLHGAYMTLSHCWGHVDCLKLTTSNYGEMTDAILVSDLPQLYKDAVSVTRKLGVRYLWIDSLCIIQEGDQHADWVKEVKTMDKVYANSYCNIAATNAPTGYHTMFHHRDPALLNPQVVHCNVNGRAGFYHIFDSSRVIGWREVEGALLNTRGWVLQERLLSPRTLHFSNPQIFWECRQGFSCETYPDGIPRTTGNPVTMFKNHMSRLPFSQHSKDPAYPTWSHVIFTYTKSQISYPSDKLVAVSAVAKVMRSILADDYVAGMWRQVLEFNLLWHMVPLYANNASRPDKYRAPSWSWAAVEGNIHFERQYDFDRTQLLYEVVDVGLTFTTYDDTGPVRDGWLQLRGCLKRLALVIHEYNEWHETDVWAMLVNGVDITRTSTSSHVGLQPWVKLDPPYAAGDWRETSETLYCMPARLCSQKPDVYVLILQVVDREKGIYRRVGFAHGWGEGMQKHFEYQCGEDDGYPCEQVHDGVYTIRII